MNTYINWKNWYGAVGLISTVGKNSFAVGEQVSRISENACWGIRQVVDIDLAITGPVFEKLEAVSKSIAEFDKSMKTTCEEWETWANEKFAEAKKQEEIKEDWEWNVNALHTFDKLSKSPCWKAKQVVCNSLGTATKKAIYRPIFRFGSTY